MNACMLNDSQALPHLTHHISHGLSILCQLFTWNWVPGIRTFLRPFYKRGWSLQPGLLTWKSLLHSSTTADPCPRGARLTAHLEGGWVPAVFIYLGQKSRLLPNSSSIFSQLSAQKTVLPSRNLCTYFFGAFLPLANAVLPWQPWTRQPASKTRWTQLLVFLFTGLGEVTGPWAGGRDHWPPGNAAF